MQRYRQAKARLQAELKDQLLTRTENLDEDHSALEYARERSELLSLEAKVSRFTTMGGLNPVLDICTCQSAIMDGSNPTSDICLSVYHYRWFESPAQLGS